MDASLYSWGALLESHLVQGRWMETDLRHNINWLELKVARLRHFEVRLLGQ